MQTKYFRSTLFQIGLWGSTTIANTLFSIPFWFLAVVTIIAVGSFAATYIPWKSVYIGFFPDKAEHKVDAGPIKFNIKTFQPTVSVTRKNAVRESVIYALLGCFVTAILFLLFHWAFKVVGVAQAVLGPIFLFLLLLAVRTDSAWLRSHAIVIDKPRPDTKLFSNDLCVIEGVETESQFCFNVH